MVKLTEMKSTAKLVEDELSDEEEPGEVIESAPPLKLGEEREINRSGVIKKLIKRGAGWETPNLGDEVTVHYVAKIAGGAQFESTRDAELPLTFKLGAGKVVKGLDTGVITMKKGEVALFTIPSDMAYGDIGHDGIPANSIVQFEVELLSWITVVDVCKDGGLIKRILWKGQSEKQPSDLDEVLVKYQIMLTDDTIVAQTGDEGIEFCIKDGHLIPALAKAVKTMKVGEKANLLVQPQYGYGNLGRGAVNVWPPVPPNSALNITMELISFNPVVDVCGDSEVIKKILEEGESLVAADEGALVTVRYIAKLEDGIVFEKKGFDGEAPLEFVTDEEQVIPGLDQAVKTMKKGEKALLTISPQHGFGEVEVKKDLATIPPSSTLVFEIELVNLVKERASWEVCNEEKIEIARKMKDEGNVLYKTGKFERAGKKYDKAANFVNEDGSFNINEQKQARDLRVQCWLNGAACNLKLQKFKETIELCSKVLDIEFHNVKALYRRAQAFMEIADLDLAELDINKALEVDPQNREVKLIQWTLKQHQAERNRRDAKLYSNMFSGLANEKTTATKKRKVANEEATAEREVAPVNSSAVGEANQVSPS